ncbi:tropomyosin-1-like [Stylophora pistillata]|uniref:EF-hand domain-containing protein n=1 Tax=Stylophora pistillata TaxID=50429 RepID=A0A2B4SA58_STYPI|nr:tropomyosin-1-like [Stylophora pistillata]PFX25412.1 hypothetical protein AWC38_SpisGene9947 [Stylophora pistillata]
MSEETNELALQRDQTTHDFVTGLKEREELKAKLHEKERECNTLKGNIYDMNKKMEELEKQLAEKNKETKKRRQSEVKKPKRPAQRKRDKGTKGAGERTPDESNKENIDNPFDDPEKLYQEIARRYPDVPLSTVLLAEKKFVEADLDRNGTIDSDELEKMLDLIAQQGSSLMYTKTEIREKIFKKIDVDNTNSIDFFECIGILEMMRQNRSTDLPAALQQNKSAVCAIQ